MPNHTEKCSCHAQDVELYNAIISRFREARVREVYEGHTKYVFMLDNWRFTVHTLLHVEDGEPGVPILAVNFCQKHKNALRNLCRRQVEAHKKAAFKQLLKDLREEAE